MGRHEDRRSIPEAPPEDVEEPIVAVAVLPVGRLVEHEEAGPPGEGGGKGEAPLLAPGELSLIHISEPTRPY